MGLSIGHGIGIPFKKGQNWSSYWATRYISGLSVVTTSDTEQTVTATIVGTGYDRVSFEYSTDGVTFVEHGSSENGTYVAEGLISYTIYFWRARLYKGGSYSNYSLVDKNSIAITNPPATVGDLNVVDYWRFDDTDKFTCYSEDNNTILKWIGSINGIELKQNDHTQSPVWWPDGVYSTGVRYLKSNAFTLNQPTTIYILLKQTTWNNTKFFIDGAVDASMTLYQASSTPGLKVSAGSASNENNNLPLNEWGIVRIIFNGANSKFQINETAAITGNFGSNNHGGVTIFRAGTTTSSGVVGYIKDLIIRNIADNESTFNEIYAYLLKRKNVGQYVDGNNRFFVPSGFTKYSKVILYVHGSGEDQDAFMHSSDKHNTKMAFIKAGFGVIECLASGNNWGNQTSLTDYQTLITWAKSIIPFTDLNIYAQSMGGLTGMHLFMTDTSINKFVGIYPALSLANMFTTSYKAAIKTAYGFSNDADYATATAGYDPMLLSGSNLNHRKIELVASPSDVTVTKTDNTDAFNTAFGSLADITVVVASGVHGDPSHFDGTRDVDFFNS